MRNILVGLAGALLITITTNGCSNGSGGGGNGGTASGGGGNGGTASGGAGNSGTAGGSAGKSTGGVVSGGSQGSGGSTGGATANCPTADACGGDVVGTWTVTSSCLKLSGNLDATRMSMGCQSVPVTGALTVTGKWTANRNNNYKDETTTTGSMNAVLDASCLKISMAPVECVDMNGAFVTAGWTDAKCSKDSSGKCNCTATVKQVGGIGMVSPWASDTGTYKASSEGLKLDDMVDYSYCVSGSTLTVIPGPTILPITGTIVLQGSGGTPAGGAGGSTSGSGGRTGTGGATSGTGGATAGTTSGTGGSGTGGSTSGTGGRSATGGRTATTGGTTASGGTSATGGTTSTGGATAVGGAAGKGPCDIYGAANAKCAAAHSTVRALFSSYTGKLYQVKRASDSKTQDISVGAGGFADSAAQDTFCTGTTCVITFVYDQSGNGNDVEAETADSKVGGNKSQTAANAAQEQFMASGHKVYSLYLKQSQAYWKDGSKSNMPLGKSPQGVYMVTSGTRTNISGCCFDYGNGPLSRSVSGCGTMDAVNFSTNKDWEKGAGSGPWVMADFECGLKAGGNPNANDPAMTMRYVTAIEKNNGTSEYQLRGADATTGKLGTFYKGKLPFTQAKEGAIILGSGGDCCYSNTTLSSGTFYEGAIVAGYPTDETDDAVQENIVNAGYGK